MAQHKLRAPSAFLKGRIDKGDQSAIECWGKAKQWDRDNPSGEGVTGSNFNYQWVRVQDEGGKVLATFFLGSENGEVWELFIVSPQAGLSPNPFDRSGVSMLGWLKIDQVIQGEAKGDERKDARPRDNFDVVDWQASPDAMYAFSGNWEHSLREGGRPVSAVVPLPMTGAQVQFKFRMGPDSFTVRGEKLAAVLYGIRQSGMQHISVRLLRLALNRLG